MAVKGLNYKRPEDDSDNDFTKKIANIRSFQEVKVDWRKYCEYWRLYPDKFIDFIRPSDCKIDLYFYQRIMLRVLFRYQKVYFTFTRGTAKSFTQILALYLKCIMYPGTELFICAPGKAQAADISQANIEKIWSFFPVLKDEIKEKWFQNDYTELKFHNGSKLEVVPVSERARGGRNNGGAIEEIVDDKMKKDILNEAIIPRMANDRLSSFQGKKDANEIHKFEWYITTSGTRQSFAFEKMKEILGEMAQGKSAFNLGAGFELACMHEQLSETFINDLKNRPTFNPLSFAREYESIWTGTSDNSLVQLEDLQECRTISKAEHRHSGEKNVEYILAYDVARSEGSQNANCALVVIKIIPRGDGTYQKHLVNLYSFEGTHFLTQAIFLKKKVNEFKASMLIVDSNGPGKGLVDVLVTECDENPSYSVINDDRFDKYKTENSIPMVYALSSNTKENSASDIHNVFVNMITNKKVKILQSESEAKSELSLVSKTRKKKKDTESNSEQLSKDLMPYVMCDLLCEEIMNLEHKQEGNKTKIKQISRSINKDKFSAFEYGLYYIYTLEMKNQRRKKEKIDVSQFFAVKVPTTRYRR
jgi:hypothetical protein